MARQLPILCTEVPEYEARAGIMHIRWSGLELAIPIPVFEKCMARGNRELDRWHESHGRIVEFPASPH